MTGKEAKEILIGLGFNKYVFSIIFDLNCI